MVYGDNRVAMSPSHSRGRPQTVQRRFTHREFFERWIKVGRIKKMSTVTTSGSRLEQLKNLSKVLAKQIDDCNNDMIIGPKYLPQLSKQYRETIKEIEEIEGVDREDDEIGEILSARKADGKPDAVR